MKRLSLLLASLLGLVVACTPQATPTLPTPIPPEALPTIIAQTAEAANLAQTETALAALSSDTTPTFLPTRRPTRTPTPAATFTITSIPGHKQSAILITAPGPMSKVISPITLKLDIVTGASKLIQIDLYGEDGRLLTRLLKEGVPTSTDGVAQTIKIPFEIRAAAEVGRITISTQDEVGRVQSLNSVRVILLSTGVNEVTTPGNPSEPVRVTQPTLKDTASKGVLTVKGDIWPFNLEPIIIELIDPKGKTLSLRVLNIQTIDPQLFETTLPYRITEPMLARLVIRQDDDRMDGIFYLYSQEILLNP